jgi:hypothetical protein
MSGDLQDFVQAALGRGLKRDEVAAVLRQAGWGEPDIKNALGAFADLNFPLPVPVPKPYVQAGDAFRHLLFFAALMAVTVNGVGIAFEAIDRFITPISKIGGWVGFLKAIRMNLSVLLVFAPLFVLAAVSIGRAIKANPTRRHSKPRKWVANMAMFATAIVLCGVLIGVIHGALAGEINALVVLKSLVIVGVGGAIFAAFRRQMIRDDRMR